MKKLVNNYGNILFNNLILLLLLVIFTNCKKEKPPVVISNGLYIATDSIKTINPNSYYKSFLYDSIRIDNNNWNQIGFNCQAALYKDNIYHIPFYYQPDGISCSGGTITIGTQRYNISIEYIDKSHIAVQYSYSNIYWIKTIYSKQ